MSARTCSTALLFLFLLPACTTMTSEGRVSSDQLRAACSAQAFLGTNGYLDRPATSDREDIFLELWDKLTYSKNGQLDWDALLAARRRTFAGRLYGVKAVEGGFVVAYKMDKACRCIFVSADSTVVHLNEATCHPEEASLERLSESSLSCPAAGENK